MAGETHFAPQTELEPEPDWVSADPDAEVDTDLEPDSVAVTRHAVRHPGIQGLRHPAAWAHRAAVMRKVQQVLGNRAAQTVLRRDAEAAPHAKAEIAGPGAFVHPQEKSAKAKAAKEKEIHEKAKKEKQAVRHEAQALRAAAEKAGAAKDQAHGAPKPTHGPAAAQAPPIDHEAALPGIPGKAQPAEAMDRRTPEAMLTDAQAAVAVRGEWLQQALDLPLADPLVINFAAPSSLDLHVNTPPKPDPAEPRPPDQQEAIREATLSFGRLNQEASRDHRETLDRANEIRRDIAGRARDATSQIDSTLTSALDSAVQVIDTSRTAITAAFETANQTLEERYHAARTALGGAAGGARKTVATARGSVDKQLAALEKKILDQYQASFDKKANELAKIAADTVTKLRSAETQSAVAGQFNGIDGLRPPVMDAQAEAQQAAVPRLLNELATGVETTSAKQVDKLRHGTTNPQENGTTIKGNVEDLSKELRKMAVGGGAAPAPAPAAAGKKKDEPLFDQAGHAVDRAFGQAAHALDEQIKAARVTIVRLRDGALQQCTAYRSAIFGQISSIRQARLDAVRRAAMTAMKSIEDGTRSALPSYADGSLRAKKSLEDAAAKGPDQLLKMASEGLPGATRSIDDGKALQLRRLDQVAQGASSTIARESDAAGDAVSKLLAGAEVELQPITSGASRDMDNAAAEQGQSLAGLTRSVATSATNYTRPLESQFAQTIADRQKEWFPDTDKVAHPPDATPKPAGGQGTAGQPAAAAKPPEEAYEEMGKNPKPNIDPQEKLLANRLAGRLTGRAQSAFQAFGNFSTDENKLMAALRGMTARQGVAVSDMFANDFGGGNLEARIRHEYDLKLSGLNKHEFLSAINSLHGNSTAGALYELKTTEGIFSSDGKRAEEIMRGLTTKEREQLKARPDWPKVSGDVKDGLSGADLDVFNALEDSNLAKADAIRLKEKVDTARREDDKDAYFKAIEQYHPEGSDREEKPVSFADVKAEFAKLTGDLKPGEVPTETRATEIFKTYITQPVTIEVPVDDGGQTMPVTYKVEGADLALANALAVSGPGSKDARAARILREAERKTGKVDFEGLEGAVVDDRLNPSKTPDLTPEQRKKAKEEQDELFQAYAALARQYGFPNDAATPKAARELAAEKLKDKFDKSDDPQSKDSIGRQYVESIVTKDVPDTAAGVRYAILGVGTDEKMVHRNLQRMSKAEVETARAQYSNRFKDIFGNPADMDEDLGVYGKGWFGDLSGDERLQAERELLGVPQNDKERAELAIFTIRQQQEETGIVGRLYNSGSNQENAMLANRDRVEQAVGGKVEIDKEGRPTIVGGNFDPSGKFTGANINQLMYDVDLASLTAQNYSARVDELASVVTTAIAIYGAVVAAIVTVATGGAASPLLMAAIAGVSGALAIGANELIKGGRYGWEQAALDLGMTAVQAISAGVGQSLALAARGGAAAVSAGMRALVVKELPAEMTKLAGSQFANMVLSGAVTGSISGLGGAVLNEQTWEKGLTEGIRQAMLGMVKGALSGAVTSAVTAGIDQTAVGKSIQGMSAEGGLIRGGLNVLGRGLGRSAISATGAVAGRGAELAFDATTGKFHGNLHDALHSLGEAGREAALRGLFEGGGEAAGKRIENQHMAALQKQAEQAKTAAPQTEAAKTPAAPLDETMQAPKLVPPPVDERVPAPAKAPPAAAEAEIPKLPAPPEPVAPKPPMEAEPGVPRPPMEAAPEVAKPLVEGMPEAAAPPIPAAKPEIEAPRVAPPRIDEQAAAGIIGSRATGDAAERYGLRPVKSGDIEPALTKLVAPEGPAARYGKVVEAEDGSVHLELETKTDANRDPVKVKVRIELVDGLPRETGGPALDTRFAQMADGRRVELEPYRRNANGEWEDRRTMAKVTDPELQSALEQRRRGVMPMAMFEPDGSDGYVIKVAKGTPTEALERALAHELAEIRAVHGQQEVEQKHALAPGSDAKTLSPHDEGRLAELVVLSRKANADTPEGRRAFDEAQRLAAHLGLTGESEGAAARRALALNSLGEETGKFLVSAIAEAAENPFLKPLTGDLRTDLETLGKRLESARRTGELEGTPAEWFPRDAAGRPRVANPVARELVEQIRQMLIRDEVVALKLRTAPRKQPPSGVPDFLQTQSLRAALSPEMRAVFDHALSEAIKPGGHRVAILEPELDPSTAAATRARFGDLEKFDDWPAFKTKYLAANPGLEHETIPGEFADPVSLRKAFDRWAKGRYMPEDSKFSRSLLAEDLRPDPRFTAQFSKEPEAMQKLVLGEKITIVEGKDQRVIPTEDAINERNRLMEEASAKRTQADAREKVGDVDAAEQLRAEADDLLTKVRPLSEAFGVLAGRSQAAELGATEIIELHGSGVPDLLIVLPNGKLAVIECKGGDSPLGTRLSADGSVRVQQGTREYLESLAQTMVNSGKEPNQSLGLKLQAQLADPTYTQEYYYAQQPFDPNGRPLPPVIGQFDTRLRVVIEAENEITRVRIAAQPEASPRTRIQLEDDIQSDLVDESDTTPAKKMVLRRPED